MKIVLYLSVCLGVLSCNQLSDCDKKDIYFIPNGFKGYVYVIYNVENGAKEKMDDNVQINMISSNGIYLAEYSPRGSDKNLLCDEFYYIDSLEAKEKIESLSIGKKKETGNNILLAEYFGSRIFYKGFAFDYIRIGPKNREFWRNKKRRTPEFLIDSLNLRSSRNF